MHFETHSNLINTHAVFSPSQPAWLRYDDEKALEVFHNKQAAAIGTELHAYAAQAIKLGIKQPKSNKTLYRYINDAIGFHMDPEVTLFYSDMFYGTADAISFKNNVLRVSDLKTGTRGTAESHYDQLMVYAALFCLEYEVDPLGIDTILRVYKSDEMAELRPDPSDVKAVMDHIVHLNELLHNEQFK